SDSGDSTRWSNDCRSRASTPQRRHRSIQGISAHGKTECRRVSFAACPLVACDRIGVQRSLRGRVEPRWRSHRVWDAPTTNTDGSPLTQLALYRLYYSTSDAPCPGNTFLEVASSPAVPPLNQTVSVQLTGLRTGWVYSVSVTAVNTSGSESACSEVASAIAQDESAITPTAPAIHAATPPAVQDGSANTPPPPTRRQRRQGR